jgi:Rrf2 family protein
MKFSAQEEYGLRCLLQIARHGVGASLTIPEIAQAEGLSAPNVAKLMRILRRGGFVQSARGQAGGYNLARTPQQINVGEVLAWLGGRLFESNFRHIHAGVMKLCTHSVDCSIRSLWSSVQFIVDQVLNKVTIEGLLTGEREMSSRIDGQTQGLLPVAGAALTTSALRLSSAPDAVLSQISVFEAKSENRVSEIQ